MIAASQYTHGGTLFTASDGECMTPLDLKYTCGEMLFMRNPRSVANFLLVSVYSCVQQAAVTEVHTPQLALAIHPGNAR